MENRIIEPLEKLKIIFFNFSCAVPTVVFVNLFFAIIFRWTPLLYVDYLTTQFSFVNGFFAIDNITIGLHIIPNLFLIVFLWIFMIYETLNATNHTFLDLFPFLENKFMSKITNLFFR